MFEHPTYHPFPVVPLEHHATLATSRFEEAVAGAARLQHPLRADWSRPRAPFRFELNHVDLGPASLSYTRMRYGASYTVSSETTGDDYHFQLSLGGGARVKHGRAESVDTGPTRGVLLSPGRETRWRGDAGFREISVKLDPGVVADHFEALCGRPVAREIVFEPAIDLRRGPGAAAARAVGEIVDRIDGAQGLQEESIAHPLECLLDALLLGLPHDHSALLRLRIPAGSRDLVGQAEEYIESHLAEPLTIRRVALAMGVSIRTLQRSFARHREHSPKQYMATQRLERARSFLLTPDSEASVTAIAFASGHTHLGQFSVNYRRRYGETPSKTLQRTRSAVASPIAIPSAGA